MGQNDTASGQRGDRFGREAASRVAQLLGATLLEENGSNLISLAGTTAVIKSAHKGTGDIGITKTMLPKLDAAYAVLERENDQFEVYRVDRGFLESNKRTPASKSGETQWFYSRSDIRRLGTRIDVFDLSQPRRYWVTTQWPHRVDTDPDAPREGIYLPDGREQAGAKLSPGDLVAVYEAKTGRALIRKDVEGRREVVKCRTGRQGIVALVRVTSKLCSDDDSKPQKYTDGTQIWWRWYADAEPYLTSGFMPREQLNTTLGYAPDNPLKGFGDLHSGLKEIDRETFLRINAAFVSTGAVPELGVVLRQSGGGRGGGGEGPVHLLIKTSVAAEPARILGEPGLRTIQMEYPFPTGDSADILLEDAAGKVIGLEVEPAVGDNDLPGILQAIKYRYMGALMRNKRFEDSRAFLVAGSISPVARKICEAYDIECFVVDLATLVSK